MDLPTPGWVPDAVVYALFPDRFARTEGEAGGGWDTAAFEPWDAPPGPHAYKGGDLRAAASRLPWLAEVGFTAVVLTPIFTSTTYHRYKPVRHDQVDPLLGGDAAFDEFLDEAHRQGLRVILDGVFNHVGIGFQPFLDALEYGPASPWRDWFLVERWPLNPFDLSRPAHYRSWHDHRSMPQLNTRNPAVQEYIYGVVQHWVRKGIDGWRFDAPAEIGDAGFWRELRRRVHAVRADVFLYGEIWTEAEAWLDGTQWDGVTDYPLADAWHRFVAGPRRQERHLHPEARGLPPLDAPAFAARIEQLLRRYPWQNQRASLSFVNTHDVARFLTVTGGDRASVELATVLMLTFPGVPCVYHGDEVGLEGGMDPDCRRGYPPPERWDLGCLDLHRRLIALRRSRPALRRGRFRIHAAERGVCIYSRMHEDDTAIVVVNTSDVAETLEFDVNVAELDPLPQSPMFGHGRLHWSGVDSPGHGTAFQPPRSASVFGCGPGSPRPD